MFSPSLLYDRVSNQKTVIGFHAIAMAHMCRNFLTGIPGGTVTALQMQSLNFRTIADTDMNRYLLAKDSYGYQVIISSTLAWKDQWSDIMQAGIGAYPDFSSTGFLALLRIANLIYLDLITQVTLTDNIFIVGQGPYAYVASLVAKKLLLHSNRVSQVYVVAAPRSFTPDVWNALEALDVPHTQIRAMNDESTECPPSLLSFDGWVRGLLTFIQGRNTVLPDLSRFGMRTYVGHGASAVGRANQGWPNTNATRHISEPLHWHDDVDAVAVAEASTENYINRAWETLTRDFHARLDDWRTLLNGNYGFNLQSLQNLGI